MGFRSGRDASILRFTICTSKPKPTRLMGIDPVHEVGIWAIGLLRGFSLNGMKPTQASNPIVTANDFVKWNGRAVADPFAHFRDGAWYLFFELFQWGSNNAVIGASRSSNLKDWEPLGIVLKQPHHLSYPFVFEHDGQIYMMPESKSVKRVDLYRAVEFPYRWKFEKTILQGRLMDCSMVKHQGRFWIFAGWRSYGLKLYHASHPLGPWKSHWLPCIRFYSRSSARPGGRPVHLDSQLIRFSQDCTECYGKQLRAWKVTRMNRLWYSEVPLFDEPLLTGSGHGWNARCMHHIDAFRLPVMKANSEQHEWIAFVDGCA